MGIGEILLTSIDQDGTRKGFDTDLVQQVKKNISVPLIVSGGMGTIEDLTRIIEQFGVDAVAMATVLHKNIITVKKIREILVKKNFLVRKYEKN